MNTATTVGKPLSISGLTKTYDTRGGERVEALGPVSIDVAAGEFLVVVGPSGCGKSTLLNLIAGLDLPTSGTIHLDGRSTAGFSSDDWTRIRRQSIGIVFQAFHLIPGLTVEENVAFPLLLRGEQGRKVRERVADVLALVRMTRRAAHRPSELSGGEQQRVAVARALANRPVVVLADEPSGNLDTHTSEQLHELFFRLRDEHGVAMVLATHNLELADRADRVVLVKDAQLHEL